MEVGIEYYKERCATQDKTIEYLTIRIQQLEKHIKNIEQDRRSLVEDVISQSNVISVLQKDSKTVGTIEGIIFGEYLKRKLGV